MNFFKKILNTAANLVPAAAAFIPGLQPAAAALGALNSLSTGRQAQASINDLSGIAGAGPSINDIPADARASMYLQPDLVESQNQAALAADMSRRGLSGSDYEMSAGDAYRNLAARQRAGVSVSMLPMATDIWRTRLGAAGQVAGMRQGIADQASDALAGLGGAYGAYKAYGGAQPSAVTSPGSAVSTVSLPIPQSTFTPKGPEMPDISMPKMGIGRVSLPRPTISYLR